MATHNASPPQPRHLPDLLDHLWEKFWSKRLIHLRRECIWVNRPFHSFRLHSWASKLKSICLNQTMFHEYITVSGSGYLDLLEDQSNENGLKADVSLDDLVEPLSGNDWWLLHLKQRASEWSHHIFHCYSNLFTPDEESSGSEDHSRQDSGFIDTFDAMKIQREVMKKCLESTPPPLPPRDWSPVKRGLNSSPRTSPLSCSPVEKETVVTHLWLDVT